MCRVVGLWANCLPLKQSDVRYTHLLHGSPHAGHATMQSGGYLCDWKGCALAAAGVVEVHHAYDMKHNKHETLD